MGKRVVRDATNPLSFNMTDLDKKKAVPFDEQNCAVAIPLKRNLGGFCERVFVGPTVVKIMTPGMVTRYKTPKVIQDAIPEFDKTGVWKLPSGRYTLYPVPKSMKLGKKAKKSKSKVRKRKSSHSGKFGNRLLVRRRTTNCKTLAKS